jgi:protocatechuate 3,4-dioxygenase beta subunit
MPDARELARPSRRRVFAAAAVLAVVPAKSRLFAAARSATPRQTAGPFYPKVLPLDTDNDLVRIAGHHQDASGTIAHIFGRVLGAEGEALPEARVEIWQCDSHGRYHHVDDGRGAPPLDPDFQGYGTTVSAADGGYRFRTIRPVPYPGRTPHIHFAITTARGRRLVTQMYVAGEKLNDRDPVLAQIQDPAARASVIVPLAAAPEAEAGAVQGAFDIVLG